MSESERDLIARLREDEEFMAAVDAFHALFARTDLRELLRVVDDPDTDVADIAAVLGVSAEELARLVGVAQSRATRE